MRLKISPATVAVVLAVALAAGFGAAAAAQPEPPKNLQVFPKEISRQELIGEMRQFAFALGVACTHCHGTEEQTGRDLRGVDFSLDIKPTKAKAREMLRMTEEINSKLLSRIPASDLDLRVRCFTCHSGLALPETIEARVLRKIEAEGLAAAVEDYRAVREEEYGSAAYNFLEQPLVEVAADLHKRGRYEEAAGISELNLEFHPDSGQSKLALAEAYAELGDRESARRLYGEMLEQHPGDPRLEARLEQLAGPGEPD